MTRAKLHELVWSKPIIAIAKEYGVPDQHIAQICDAYEIARPRPGYWQKREYGKVVETVALNNKHHSPEEIIIIDPAVGRLGRSHISDGDGTIRRWATHR